jgi:hypothetical protein
MNRSLWTLIALGVAVAPAAGCPFATSGDATGDDRAKIDGAIADSSVADSAAHDRAPRDGALHDSALHDGAIRDGAIPDSAAGDARLPDRGARDRAPGDYGAWDTAACNGPDAAWAADHGFCIRVPQMRDVLFTDVVPPSYYPMLDGDYVCTLDYGTIHGFAYVQARPTSCRNMGGCTTTTVDGAWVSIGGTVSPVTASYSWGGNHHNESIRVSYAGKVFEYNHSSITSWARTCHPPDCTLVFQADGTTLIENGCTPARTLPQVCVKVTADGTVPSLVDTFAPCPGDPNFMDASSGG